MKFKFVFSLIILSIVYLEELKAQYFIGLNNNPSDTFTAPFFIKDVIDSRKDKLIGIIVEGDSTQSLEIKTGLRNSLIKYADGLIVEKELQQSVILKVDFLHIKIDSGNVSMRIELNFLLPSDSLFLSLFTLKYQKDSIGDEGVNISEKLLATTIIESLKELNFYFHNPSEYLFNNQYAQPQIIDLFPPDRNIQSLSTLNVESDPLKTSFIFMGGAQGGMNSLGYSISFLHVKIDDNDRWATAGRYTMDKLFNVTPTEMSYDIYKAEIFYLKLGIQPMCRLVGNLWFYMPFQVPVGVEVYSRRQYYRYNSSITDRQIFIGLNTGQGLCYLSNSTYGLYVGTHVYQFVSNSIALKFDVGLSFEFGFKF
jgi:hypothetical protein